MEISSFLNRYALWLALPVGAALSLAFAPFDWWPLAIACPAFLFLAWHDATPRLAAKLGFLFTAGKYLAGTYWLYNSIHGIGKAPLWLTFFVMLAMVAILSSYTAFVGYALARWFSTSALQRVQSLALALRYLLILPAAWVVLEWFRGWFMSGFPWLALGYSQTGLPLGGLAPLGGIYAVSLALAICAGAVALLFLGDTRARVIAAASIAVLWIAGFASWQRVWTAPAGAPITVAIVQGAIPQDRKWSTEYRDSTVRLYNDLSLPHLGQDIILWPESALPILAHNATGYLDAFSQRAAEKGSRLVTGLVRYDFDTDKYYNGVVALDAETQWYHKRRLVPFGEFFPVPKFIREWLRLMNLPYSDISAGERDQPALRVKGQKLGITICYEDAYAAEQLEVLKEATVLVNVTNDAWFGDSTAAHQHLQISRMRALEAGRPLLRAANDGISAIIAADGGVVSTLPRFQPGVLTGAIQPRTGLTPYARVGNVPVISACMFLLLCVLALQAVPRLQTRLRSQAAGDSNAHS